MQAFIYFYSTSARAFRVYFTARKPSCFTGRKFYGIEAALPDMLLPPTSHLADGQRKKLYCRFLLPRHFAGSISRLRFLFSCAEVDDIISL